MRVLICFVLAVSVVYGKVAPEGFPACKRNDPKIDKCFRDGIEVIRPKLKAGIPEVNIPPLEPFSVPTLRLDRTAPNLRLKAVIKNMKAIGGGDFRLDKLKIKLDKGYAADLKLFIPRLSVSGDYDVQGSRLLVLDISGKGKLKSNFTGITVVAKGSAKPIVKDDVTYLQAEKIVTKLRIADGELEVDDTERPVAAASAASFFNSNPKVVLDILNPIIEDTAAAIIKAFINKILGSIPMNELILDD